MFQIMAHSSSALASLTKMNKLQTTHTERLVVGEHRHTETLAGLDVNKTIVNQVQHTSTTMDGVHRNISQLAANHLPIHGSNPVAGDNSRSTVSQGSNLTRGRSQSRETFVGSPPDGFAPPAIHDSGFGFHPMHQQLQQLQQSQLGLQPPPENLAIHSSQDYVVPSQVLQQEDNKMSQDVPKPNPNPNPKCLRPVTISFPPLSCVLHPASCILRPASSL